MTTSYIGRFAPSPTGPLHFGSLIAAVASYLDARQFNQSKWLLRIEDVDIYRSQKGASISIIKTLEHFGFEWDQDIIYQSQRTDAYQAALDSIRTHIYPCSCTRKELQATAAIGKYSYIYPGFCRKKPSNNQAERLSIRVLTQEKIICFQDQCQPKEFCQNIEQEIGDFILKRSDGLFAYQLAVVVDDAWQGITNIVRGADLFDNTPRQIYLQQLLGYPQIDYLHFPVAVTNSGKKLSKQNSAPEVSTRNKRATLVKALTFLGQNPPDTDEFLSLNDLWKWAINNWNSSIIPRQATIKIDD